MLSLAASTASDSIYETGGTTTVWVFDGRQCNAGSLTSCAAATPGAVTPFPQPGFEATISAIVDADLHTVYVSYQKDDALIAFDSHRCNGRRLAACETVAATEIHTGANPESAALDPLTQTLYTADQTGDTVSVIDATRCSARATGGCRRRVPEVAIPGVPDPGGVAGPDAVADFTRPAVADPAAHTVYVPGPTGVSLIDSRGCNGWSAVGCAAPPPTALPGPDLAAATADPGTHTVYIADRHARTVSVLDDRTCNARVQSGCAHGATLSLSGGLPVAIAVNSFTHALYVAAIRAGDPEIDVFDAGSCSAGRRSGCDHTPATVALGDDGDEFSGRLAVAGVRPQLLVSAAPQVAPSIT